MHTADNREIVGSNPTIPTRVYNSAVEFLPYKKAVTGSNPVGPIGNIPKLGSVAESGLLQNPAKIPCRVIGTVGSNPTTSARRGNPIGDGTCLENS